LKGKRTTGGLKNVYIFKEGFHENGNLSLAMLLISSVPALAQQKGGGESREEVAAHAWWRRIT